MSKFIVSVSGKYTTINGSVVTHDGSEFVRVNMPKNMMLTVNLELVPLTNIHLAFMMDGDLYAKQGGVYPMDYAVISPVAY